jgi:threonyl-tRNA synthetase
LGTVYRYERSGTLQGLLRVRGFTQDDAHIFCTPDQLLDEVAGVLELVNVMMRAFKYEYSAWLATMPEKHLGTEEEWARSTAALRQALDAAGLSYQVDDGGGVFYAPKIDIKLTDAIGREWQGPTIQVDLNLPKRFNLTYVGPDGIKHEVVMIHRTVLGSMERFLGGLLEHFAGAMPLWLAPEQVRLITITDAHRDYASQLVERLRGQGLRVSADLRNEKTGFKVREATLAKIPYVLVVGDQEVRNGTASVRRRGEGNLGPWPVDKFVACALEEIAAKT